MRPPDRCHRLHPLAAECFDCAHAHACARALQLNILLTATTFYGEPAGLAHGEGKAAPRRLRQPRGCTAGHPGQKSPVKVMPAFCARAPAAQEVLNTAFSALVILELAIKLTAMGPRLYWRSNWNKLVRVRWRRLCVAARERQSNEGDTRAVGQ